VGFGLCLCFCFGRSKLLCKFSSGSGHQQFSSFSVCMRISCLPMSARSVVSFLAATSHDRFLLSSFSSFHLTSVFGLDLACSPPGLRLVSNRAVGGARFTGPARLLRASLVLFLFFYCRSSSSWSLLTVLVLDLPTGPGLHSVGPARI
jgi:hypothetical protein